MRQHTSRLNRLWERFRPRGPVKIIVYRGDNPPPGAIKIGVDRGDPIDAVDAPRERLWRP